MSNIFLTYIGTRSTIQNCLNVAAYLGFVTGRVPQLMTSTRLSVGGHFHQGNTLIGS